jgi:phosphohistidine phosphatase
MELYLVQHGEATPKEANPARPLAERGRADVLRVARAVHAAGVAVSAIFHSGKLRAQQTAEIIAAELQVAQEPAVLDGLSPNDDPATVAAALDSLQLPAMLVGHLPHMSRLCSLLLTGDPEQLTVRFRMGGIVCLTKEDSEAWRVGWMLTPQVIPAT